MDVLGAYHSSNISYFAFARHALVEALRRSGISHGDRVALPGFICRDVLASIHVLGASPVYYEIDESLHAKSLDNLPTVKAIIAVDYFGFAQNLEPFREYCSKTSAKLIEDNAHGLFSRDDRGELLGLRGDFGLLSLRKTFHVATGAALLAQEGSGISMPCIERSEGAHSLRYVLSRLERRTGIPAFAGMRAAIRVARRLAGRQEIETGSPVDETVLPSVMAIGCQSLTRLNDQDPAREINRRRQLFDKVVEDLRQVPGVHLLYDHLNVNTVPYGVPFRMIGEPSASLRALERKHHVVVMQWPTLPSEIVSSAPDHYRDVWLVNFL